MGKGKIAGGIILIILGTIFTSFGYTINNQCSSFGGQIGTLFSSEIQSRCSIGGIVLVIGVFMAIIGLVLIIVGAVSRDKRKERLSERSSYANNFETVFCRYCGKQRDLSGEFCSRCGRSIQSSSSNMKMCPSCNSQMSEDSLFCANCSKKF